MYSAANLSKDYITLFHKLIFSIVMLARNSLKYHKLGAYFSLSTCSCDPSSIAIMATLYIWPATVSGSWTDLFTHPVRFRCYTNNGAS